MALVALVQASGDACVNAFPASVPSPIRQETIPPQRVCEPASDCVAAHRAKSHGVCVLRLISGCATDIGGIQPISLRQEHI
jgi:hypothetical protein